MPDEKDYSDAELNERKRLLEESRESIRQLLRDTEGERQRIIEEAGRAEAAITRIATEFARRNSSPVKAAQQEVSRLEAQLAEATITLHQIQAEWQQARETANQRHIRVQRANAIVGRIGNQLGEARQALKAAELDHLRRVTATYTTQQPELKVDDAVTVPVEVQGSVVRLGGGHVQVRLPDDTLQWFRATQVNRAQD